MEFMEKSGAFIKQCRGFSGNLYDLRINYCVNTIKYKISAEITDPKMKDDGFYTFGNELRDTYCDGYFTTNEEDGSASFNISVGERMEKRGIGTFLLDTAFFCIIQYNKMHKVKINRLSGELSIYDEQRGFWKRSIPFYHSYPDRMDKHILSEICSVTPQFKIQKTGEIVAAQEMLQQKENGYIVFLIQYK